MPAQRRLADPDAPYWTMDDIAEYWHVLPVTIRRYRDQTIRLSRGPYLPPENDTINGGPAWYPATIIGFKRLGQGRGGGPKSGRGPDGNAGNDRVAS
jgi:hypothetical protein